MHPTAQVTMGNENIDVNLNQLIQMLTKERLRVLLVSSLCQVHFNYSEKFRIPGPTELDWLLSTIEWIHTCACAFKVHLTNIRRFFEHQYAH